MEKEVRKSADRQKSPTPSGTGIRRNVEVHFFRDLGVDRFRQKNCLTGCAPCQAFFLHFKFLLESESAFSVWNDVAIFYAGYVHRVRHARLCWLHPDEAVRHNE